jgi:HAMP domain-containing protein
MRRTADTFFVRSALGRRILLLFVVCALAPVILVTVLAFRNVTANLREQAQSQLHLSSKTVAMSILERLLILDADLRLITQQIGVAPTAMGDRDLIAGSLEEHFSAILLELENGGEQLLLGELELPGELDPLQVEHLRGGSALLVTVPATEPMGVVFMVRALDPSDPLDGLLWGRINGEYLWGIGSKSTQPPRTELCVLEGLRKPLIRSEAIPPDFSDIYVRAQAEPSNAAQRRFEWESNGARYLAGFWQIPMSTNYGCDAWTVIISEARADVFEPIASFKRDFPLVILLSLWVVLILSINQIRRSLVPLEQLRKGTRRLAKGEFSHPVVIDSEDEFAELAEAFNSMAQDLGRQFTALSTLQAIGRAALDGSQAERIVCSTLTRVPLLLPCNHASVTVFDFGSTGHARTYFSPPPDASCDHARSELVSRRHPVRLLPGLHRLSRGLVHYEADLRTSSWVLRHPDHRDLVTCSRLSVPLRVEQQLIGTLTLSAVAAQAFSEDHIDLATEVADQLAVALHQTLLREELEQEKLRLARLLEHLPSGVIVLDAQRRIVMVNRLARDLIPARADHRGARNQGV